MTIQFPTQRQNECSVVQTGPNSYSFGGLPSYGLSKAGKAALDRLRAKKKTKKKK